MGCKPTVCSIWELLYLDVVVLQEAKLQVITDYKLVDVQDMPLELHNS